jgi:hypothetical protein
LEPGGKAKAEILPRTEMLRAAGAVFESSTERDGSAIVVTREVETAQRTIAPADYPAFRELWCRRLADAANSIYLEPDRGKP